MARGVLIQEVDNRDVDPLEPPPAQQDEPDYRMSLASERTYLAYTRTSLALIAAGVAIVGVWPNDGYIALRRTMAVVLVLLGAVLAVGSRLRWRQIDRAMRAGDPLPGTYLGPLIAAAVMLVAALALLLVFVV